MPVVCKLIFSADVHYVFSFNMKEMASGMGSESRLERSKGESRQDNIHLEVGNSHISNNNEGESGHKISQKPAGVPVNSINKTFIEFNFRK